MKKTKLNEEVGKIREMMGLNEDKIAILIDGTSSSGKSVAAQLLKSVPFFKTTDKNQWVQIDSDMFVGVDNDGEKRRLKLDHPNVRDWAKGFDSGIISGLYRKGNPENCIKDLEKSAKKEGKEVNPSDVEKCKIIPKNPYENEYIEGTDPRAWYMAQEYKVGGWKKVIFDDVSDDILKYVPNVKHVLLHAPIEILLQNIQARKSKDPRSIDMVLDQYLKKYEATTSKPSEEEGDPNNPLTKEKLTNLLSKYTEDQEYINKFIKELGITGDGNYYTKAKNIDPNKTIIVNVDKESRAAKIPPAKLQQIFNKF